MKEDLLGNCRACGQLVSKNLVRVSTYGGSGGSYATESQHTVSCPHCGEADPHLTEEVLKKIKEEQEERQREIDEKNRVLQEEQVRKNKFWTQFGTFGCLWPMVVFFVICIILLVVVLFK